MLASATSRRSSPGPDRFVEIPEKIREDERKDRTYAVSIEFSDTAGVYGGRTARGAH